MVEPRAAAPAAPQLARVLGFWEVTASGVGIIVGAGIYVLIGDATAGAGAGVWMAFLIAAVLAAMTGLSYAELASMFPRASGEYEYTRQAFPEAAAFIVGWVMVAGLAVGAAAVALGFSRYFREFVDIDGRVIALGLLVVVALISLGGIKNSARITLLFSTIQVGGLLFVSVIGIDHVGSVDLTQTTGVSGVLGAAALVFFAFIGFDEVITLSEETRDPTRTVPRALLAALAISTSLYVLVAIVAVSVVGADRLGTSSAPLADVVGHAWGSGGNFISVIAMISTFNTTLLMLTAASRLTFGMASSHALPARLAVVNRRQAPAATIVAALVAAAGFVAVGDLTLIASITDTAVYFVFLAVNASVIILRLRKPGLARPFRVPGEVRGVPVIAVLGFLATIVMLAQLDWRSLVVAAAIIGAGFLVFAVTDRPGLATHE